MKNEEALFTQAGMSCMVVVCSKHTNFMNCDNCEMFYSITPKARRCHSRGLKSLR